MPSTPTRPRHSCWSTALASLPMRMCLVRPHMLCWAPSLHSQPYVCHSHGGPVKVVPRKRKSFASMHWLLVCGGCLFLLSYNLHLL